MGHGGFEPPTTYPSSYHGTAMTHKNRQSRNRREASNNPAVNQYAMDSGALRARR